MRWFPFQFPLSTIEKKRYCFMPIFWSWVRRALELYLEYSRSAGLEGLYRISREKFKETCIMEEDSNSTHSFMWGIKKLHEGPKPRGHWRAQFSKSIRSLSKADTNIPEGILSLRLSYKLDKITNLDVFDTALRNWVGTGVLVPSSKEFRGDAEQCPEKTTCTN